MPGLRETLDAATRECAPDDLQCNFMRDWANEVLADRNHEIVALVLDMGEALVFQRQAYGHLWSVDELADNGELLSRLDAIGKPEGRNDDDGKEQT